MESIGKKKIVYEDGEYTKVVVGNTFFEDKLIRVETIKGIVWIGKTAIVSIKPIEEGDNGGNS